MLITLENDQDKIVIDDALKSRLVAGLNAAARLHGLTEQTEVDITIVDDEEIHRLNCEYRDVDRPEEHLLGDIIISAETAQRQGEEFGHGLTREVVYLAVHGLLHLLGYDHMTEEDKVIMRAKEEEALREIELSEEFLEGGR